MPARDTSIFESLLFREFVICLTKMYVRARDSYISRKVYIYFSDVVQKLQFRCREDRDTQMRVDESVLCGRGMGLFQLILSPGNLFVLRMRFAKSFFLFMYTCSRLHIVKVRQRQFHCQHYTFYLVFYLIS